MGVGRGVAGVVVGTESLDFRLGDVLGFCLLGLRIRLAEMIYEKEEVGFRMR